MKTFSVSIFQTKDNIYQLLFVFLFLLPSPVKPGNLQELDSLKILLYAANSDSAKTEILNLLAYKSSPGESLEYAREALAIAQKAGYKKGIGGSLNYIGIAYHNMGDFQKALEYYFKALKARKEAGHKNEVAACYGNIGMIYQSLGDMQKAMEHYELCLNFFEETGYREAVANCLNNIANVHKENKEYEKSSENYMKAMKIYKELNLNEGIAMILNNLADIKKENGKTAEAIYYTDSALKLYSRAGNKLKIAYTSCWVGILHTELGNYGTALEHLLNSLKIAKEINAKNDIKNAYQAIYSLFEKQQDYKKALEYYLLYSQMKDTVFNEDKMKAIIGMQAKYETEKKEQTILMLAKDNRIKKIILFSAISGFILILIIILISFRNYHRNQQAKESMVGIQIEKYLTEIENLRERVQASNSGNSHSQKKPVSREELNRYLLNPLSERELEVVSLVSAGKSNKEIAAQLFVSVNTVKTHIQRIYEKLDVRNRTTAIMKAGQLDILTSGSRS